jgi:hypothetical protein
MSLIRIRILKKFCPSTQPMEKIQLDESFRPYFKDLFPPLTALVNVNDNEGRH